MVRVASMKGERTAPRDYTISYVYKGNYIRFNEGGADCPPRQACASNRFGRGLSFNEGGADCPPRPG